MRALTLTSLAMAAASIIAMSALAAPPTTEEIAAMDEKLGEWFQARRAEGMDRQELMAGMAEYADELLGDLDYGELTADDIAQLGSMLQLATANGERARARLAQLAKAETLDGAIAAVTACELVPRDDPAAREAAIEAAMGHPAITEAARDERGGGIFRMLGSVSSEQAEALKDEMLALGEAISPDLDFGTLLRLSDFVATINALEGVSEAKCEAIRMRAMNAMLEAAENEADERRADSLRSGAGFLDGAFARGKLMDHSAPPMTFKWSSGEAPITSLAALKGKVVVLDFWATWCGPCIGSFPNVREMQAHYDGYDVVIIGITSLQGRHYPFTKRGEERRAAVETEGDAEKEFALMKEFMGDADVTWTVAFTEEECFNPDYGVRGIPHVAIIDPEGKVRYNNLHPSSPLAEKTKKIDALLRKAGLPVPAPPAGAKTETKGSP